MLKEWLNLLRKTRNLKSFYKSDFLKEVLEQRLVLKLMKRPSIQCHKGLYWIYLFSSVNCFRWGNCWFLTLMLLCIRALVEFF